MKQDGSTMSCFVREEEDDDYGEGTVSLRELWTLQVHYQKHIGEFTGMYGDCGVTCRITGIEIRISVIVI